MTPTMRKTMKTDHLVQIKMLRKIRSIKGIKKAFIASGIRYDLESYDKYNGYTYPKEIVSHHISGQMKAAPEHIDDEVLEYMRKPGKQSLVDFKRLFFDRLNKESGKNSFSPTTL